MQRKGSACVLLNSEYLYLYLRTATIYSEYLSYTLDREQSIRAECMQVEYRCVYSIVSFPPQLSGRRPGRGQCRVAELTDWSLEALALWLRRPAAAPVRSRRRAARGLFAGAASRRGVRPSRDGSVRPPPARRGPGANHRLRQLVWRGQLAEGRHHPEWRPLPGKSAAAAEQQVARGTGADRRSK